MEKRTRARLVPEGALKCTIEWENGTEDGRIHNLSMQGALLEAQSDRRNRGRILWIGASNRPDLIDGAMKRSGRLGDEILIFDAPSSAEMRERMFRLFCEEYEWDEALTAAVPPEALANTETWTGSDINNLVRKAIDIYEADLNIDAPAQAIIEATKRIRPRNSDAQYMTAVGLAEITDSDLVPPHLKDQYNDREGLTDTVERKRKVEPRQQASFRKSRR